MEDSYDIEYHLTPTGWVRDTYYFFGEPSGREVPRPPDCVLTMKLSVRQMSFHSPAQRSWFEIWRSPTATKEYIEKFRKIITQRPGTCY
jgi:hypothetical protein